MPLIRPTLDPNYAFIGKGILYPFSFNEYGGVNTDALNPGYTSAVNRINGSIDYILSTRIGERFKLPEFGSRLQELVFEQNDNILKDLAQVYVVDAISRWEKRIIITSVAFDSDDPSGHVLLISIQYKIIQQQVEGNIVYPFIRQV